MLCSGDGAAGSAPVAVYETADGGATWINQEATWDVEPGGLQFLSDGRGWRWEYGPALVLLSEDGGVTWHNGGSFGNEGSPNSIWFASGNVGYAIGGRSLYRSIDGGQSWMITTKSFLT
jgi:photosystem II stability/assembly factor-like uncharacterized protein